MNVAPIVRRGVGRGIGRGIADHLAARGARIAIIDVDSTSAMASAAIARGRVNITKVSPTELGGVPTDDAGGGAVPNLDGPLSANF